MSTPGRRKGSKATGYEDLVALLRQQIESGQLAEGDRLPSFLDLQSEFRTTSNTINRALIELERDGLIIRERWRGVFVAPRRVEQRHAIGLAGFYSSTTCSPYYTLLTQGIQSVAHREQYEITLLNLDSLRGVEKVDGVLGHGEAGRCYLEKLPPNMPRVNTMMPMDNSPSVVVDDFEGALMATRHLLELGHKRIGFMGHVDSAFTQRRLAGYKAALDEASVKTRAGWVRGLRLRREAEYTVPDARDRVKQFGYVNAREWLLDDWREQKLTAVVVQNDEFAIGMMQALREEGYEVPGDVSVLGFDSTALCEMCSPRLTSVHLPLEKVGAVAAEMLFRSLHEDKAEVASAVLSVELDVRESTAQWK